MKIGSLFSGAGLGDFGFEMAGLEVMWQVEINDYCQKILNLRWPDVKKYTDIKAIKTQDLKPVDVICGGFPCQPFSVAGQRKGKKDDRYLWPEMFRIIKGVRPRWVIGENVPGIINLALDTVCADLENEDYEVWPIVFPSHALGAWHKRDRLWIMAHAKHDGSNGVQVPSGFGSRTNAPARTCGAEQFKGSGGGQGGIADVADTNITEREWSRPWPQQAGSTEPCNGGEFISDPVSGRSQESGPKQQANRAGQLHEIEWRKTWAVEPELGRVVDGCAARVDRLKCLGNGQVPACTYTIGKWIMEIENVIGKSTAIFEL